jgi:hypothetical protein
MQMATLNDAYPSRFLKAADLKQPTTLTISDVAFETLKNNGQDERKLVMSFKGTKKVLVVNKTNFEAIVDITGEDDSDHWPTHKIEAFASEAQLGSKMVPCVRVRQPAQGVLKAEKAKAKPTPPPADDDMDDEIPF